MEVILLLKLALLSSISYTSAFSYQSSSAVQNTSQACPSPCSCRLALGLRSVFCNGRGITSVPSGIPTNTELLDLSCNRITTISGGVFSDLVNLKILNLSINVLHAIPRDAFVGLVLLEKLSVFRTEVQNISLGAFSELVNLKELNLFGNMITTNISHGVFFGLENLEQLDLSDNYIKFLSNDAFSDLASLKELDISRNAITELSSGAFVFLKNLKKLDLSETGIHAIVNKTFTGLTALEELVLSGNEIQEISDDTVTGLVTLTKLDVSQNSIRAISRDAFSGLINMAEIDLSTNKLKDDSMEPGTLELPKLTTVDLSTNSYTSIPDSLPLHITTLYLYNNNITTLKRTCFENYTYLQHIVLSYNGLQRIENGSFDPLLNLETAYFESNKLTDSSFPLGVFAKNQHLKTVGIRFNQLQNVLQNLPPSVTYLDYVDNQIRTIPSFAFLSTPNLQKLEFYQGQVTTIEDNAFYNLHKLSVLDFMSDKISSTITKDTLNDLSGLQSLDLSMNNISRIQPEAFHSLTSMTSLSLCWNSLATLDAAALSTACTPRLSEVYINGNPWYCDCHLRWLREKMDNATFVVRFPQLITCSGPAQVAGKSWDVVQPSDFVCP